MHVSDTCSAHSDGDIPSAYNRLMRIGVEARDEDGISMSVSVALAEAQALCNDRPHVLCAFTV